MTGATFDTGLDLAGLAIEPGLPVFVTGGSGYVGGWIVKGLLDLGASVRVAVRDPSRAHKVAHLIALADRAPGELELFRADLLDPRSLALAMAGSEVVIHTASPFVREVSDVRRELLDPAIKGTANVLNAANGEAGVSRVVLTSSVAAMYTDACELAQLPFGEVSENCWNTTASAEYEPYNYSKTLAEQAAWRIAEVQDQWRLVALNPSLVIGPSLNPEPTSESFAIVRLMGNGVLRYGAPRLGIGAVDVRDVARAHLAAAFLPEASGRYIISGHNTDIQAMARTLLPRFGRTHPIPRRALPKAVAWAAAPLAGMSRTYVARNVNHSWRANTARSRAELRISYRPLAESVNDMFAQLVSEGHDLLSRV
jgi:nucleoside-diphosphate-sugar epimerase